MMRKITLIVISTLSLMLLVGHSLNGQVLMDTNSYISVTGADSTMYDSYYISCQQPVVFSDEHTSGLYVDTLPRIDTAIICPQQLSNQVLVTFREFDLSVGDYLEVYDCDINDTNTPTCPVLATATGGSPSSAFGGWVASNCDTTINNTGCLSFIFYTNGDNAKGNGWLADVTCERKVVVIEECPEEIHVIDDARSVDGLVSVTIPKPEFIACDGVSFGQVAITSDCSAIPNNIVVADGGTLGTFTLPIGNYNIVATSIADSTKTCTYQVKIGLPSVVCNDLINTFRSDTGFGLRVDDILENPSVGPAVSYLIEADLSKDGVGVVSQLISGVDEASLRNNVLDLTEAFPFCKEGDYPVTITKMVEVPSCSGIGSPTIQKEICNGIFHTNQTSLDIFVSPIHSCGRDLTEEDFISLIQYSTNFCEIDTSRTIIRINSIPANLCVTNPVLSVTVIVFTPNDLRFARTFSNLSILRPTQMSAPANITINCESDLSPNTTGFPMIDSDGDGIEDLELTNAIELVGESCDFIPQFTDTDISKDGNNTKTILREWEIKDRCNVLDPIILFQTIEIIGGNTQIQSLVGEEAGSIDNPLIFFPNESTCKVKVDLEDPLVVTDCGTLMATDHTLIRNRVVFIPSDDEVDSDMQLSIGSYFAEYIVTNTINGQKDTSNIYFSVREEAPVAICDDAIRASYSGDQIRISVTAIDEAALDACSSSYKREIRRDGVEEEWGEHVSLTCEDFAEEVNISMRIRDDSGLELLCWTNISAIDFIAPVCEELEDITYDCDQFHIEEFGIFTDFNGNQQFDEEEWVILIGAEQDLFEEEFGKPICTDNIDGCLSPFISQQYQLIGGSCGKATIKRRYAAIDYSLNLTVFSEQLITVNYTPDFQITFPADWEGACGEEFPEANLNLESRGCTILAWTHTDEVFESNEAGACQTIRRTFLVDNACSSNEEIVSITRETGEGKTVSAELVRDATLYQYIQILKIINKELPEITVVDIDNCILANDCQEERTFSISATDCFGSDSLIYQYELLNNGQVLLAGTSNSFTTFVTNNTTYEVKWGVSDFCGNTTWEQFSYEFIDCKQPSPICFDGINVNIGENDEAVIWANDLHQKSSDNCSGEIVAIHLWHPSLSIGQPTLEASVETIENLPQSLTLDCAHLGTQGVNIYVIDQVGNWDFCTASIDVQANNACNSVLETQTALIAGKILTSDTAPLSDVKLTVAAEGTQNSTIYSNEDGQFSFEGTKEKQYSISFEKEGNQLNGVSTFDLVLINKHILGISSFDSPYQFIAADINQSNTITAFDLVVLRQMILRLHTEFPNNTNYRFVAADYSFPTNNPLVDNFVESIEIPSLNEDVTAMDFVAIKVGDVNGSANENALLNATSRSVEKLFLNIEDKEVDNGETLAIPIKTSDLARIQSLQYSLLFEGLEILSIQEGIAQQDQLAIYQNIEIGLSWNESTNTNRTLGKEGTLCTIHAKATKEGRLSQLLSISNTILPEAVDQQSTIVDIALRFASKSTFSLYQNQPNPFSDQTIIGFNLEEAENIRLDIFSITGTLIRQYKGYYQKGYNEISIANLENKEDAIFIYRLRTTSGIQTRKMTLIN